MTIIVSDHKHSVNAATIIRWISNQLNRHGNSAGQAAFLLRTATMALRLHQGRNNGHDCR
jgi:hypothetical protein